MDRLAPAVEDPGRGSVSYQVTADQYEVVGSALLWTLEQGLGDAFTDEMCKAWTAAYGIPASTMIGVAEAVEV